MRKVYRRYLSGILGAAVLLFGVTRTASATVIFTSIPAPLPGNVASEGPEAYSFKELGDGIVFPTASGGTLTSVKVILSSWGCTSGHWFNPDPNNPGGKPCVTSPRGATFAQPITMNIYTVDNTNPMQPKAGTLLGTQTTTFQIPYRPSSDPAHCPGGQTWYSAKDATCYHGLAVPISFDFTNQSPVSLPSEVVIGVAFNTTDHGPAPLGPKPCNAMGTPPDNNCPYDSLNISTDGDVFFSAGGLAALAAGSLPDASSVIDPNGIFFNYDSPGVSCNPTTTPGILQDDSASDVTSPNCTFTGYHPELEINAKCGSSGKSRCPDRVGLLGNGSQDNGDGNGDGHGDGGDGHGDSGHKNRD